jgi:two-component system, LuxR family, sensor kinase FixL
VDTHVLDESCFWLLESAPNAMLIADAAGRIVYTNSLAEELFGYGRGELRGLTVECLLPQRYRQGHPAHRQEYSAKPQRRPMGSGLPLFGQRKDGSEVAVDIGLSPFETTAGTMTMAAVRDMTWRDRSIEELRHKEAQLEHIIDSINDVVWSISPSGDRVIFVNSAWERVYGHPHIEAQNNPGLWQQTIHPEDRAQVAEALATLPAKDQLDMEYRIVRPDGKVRWISDHATVVRDAQGVSVRIDGIGRDITQRKQVEERQAVLVHELKSANEELKNFAYVVSHDLKAPLRAIGSLAEWIATDYADKFDDDGREQLRLLVGRARRMDALIDGILQYSRVGHTQEGRTDVDIAALLHEVIDSLAPPAHIQIEIDTPLPTVHVERTRMQQVFQNLISNAIKYIDKPQGKVHVGCIPENKTWKFYVRDNGPGIEQRHFERIFQLFQTLMPRDRVESTGVGLALVKKIIELHDGSVWLESKVGEGSTFFFTLPRHGQ